VGLADFQARRLVCRTAGVLVDTVYVPAQKRSGKIAFLEALRADHDRREGPLVLAGDFNVCFDERDLASPTMISDAELHPRRPEDLAFRRLLEGRLTDCFRVLCADGGHYSWFSNSTWAPRRNRGMRLDYVFATAELAASVAGVQHDREPLGWDRPSDHVPVRALFG
jgi:exodeoxyribonuclease III